MRVRGEGPIPCDLMFIGEAPGEKEDQLGCPFVGKTGREIDRNLNGYQLPEREDVYLTNLVKERPPKNRDPKPDEIKRDEADLLLELEMVRPKTIVTLGRLSTRYFLGDVDLETVFGIPHTSKYGTVFPLYHPAAAFHAPELQSRVAYGFQRLGLYIKGKLPVRSMSAIPLVYREVNDPECQMPPLGYIKRIGLDTEGTRENPWCLTFAVAPGRAFLIRAADRKQLDAFGWWLSMVRPRIVMQGALYDLAVLRAMGIDIEVLGLEYDDTQILAYLLGLEPLDLKALAYRHAGMKLREYMDLVRPHDEARVRQWLAWHQGQRPDDKKIQKSINLLLTKTAKQTLRQRWQASTVLRAIPQPETVTLNDLPFDEALMYACGDADATLRIVDPLMQQLAAYTQDGTGEETAA